MGEVCFNFLMVSQVVVGDAKLAGWVVGSVPAHAQSNSQESPIDTRLGEAE